MNAPRRRNPRDDPFHDGPRPTPGHDMGDRYDYRKECPPEQTRERDRSTGIADAYYAAYLRGEVLGGLPSHCFPSWLGQGKEVGARRDVIEVVELEPLVDEVGDAADKAWVIDHPQRLRSNSTLIGQEPFRGCG